MSLVISNIRLPFDEPEEQALAEAYRLTGLTADQTQAAVNRVSIDARRDRIFRVYSVRLDLPGDEKAFCEKLQIPFVRYKPNDKPAVPRGAKRLMHRPVVVGFGPAGLFAAYTLAKYGYAPLAIWTSATRRSILFGVAVHSTRIVIFSSAKEAQVRIRTVSSPPALVMRCAILCWRPWQRMARRPKLSKKPSLMWARIFSRMLCAPCGAILCKTAARCVFAPR